MAELGPHFAVPIFAELGPNSAQSIPNLVEVGRLHRGKSARLGGLGPHPSPPQRSGRRKDFDIPSDVGDIEKELADLKRRRHEASLDCELRDYVTLAAVRKKEQDWWGTSGANSVAYKEVAAGGGGWSRFRRWA